MRTRGFVTVGLALLALASVGVASANDAPLAEAGLDQETAVNTTVYLDAGGSVDPDGRIDRLEWTIEAPDGSTLAPDCETCPTTWFVPSQVGQYNVTIQVVDNGGSANEDTLYLNVEGRAAPVSGTPSASIPGPGAGSPGGSGGGLGLPGVAGGCTGCSGSGSGNGALLVNEGDETLISPGVVEPWDTVTVEVAGGENMEIDGEDFIAVERISGRAPLSEFSSEMSEHNISPIDVENSMTGNTIDSDYGSTRRIVSRTLDNDMESINDNFENSVLSGLHSSSSSYGSDNADEASHDGPSGPITSGDEDSSNGYGSDFDSDSSAEDDASSDSGSDDTNVDSDTISDFVGNIGPHP